MALTKEGLKAAMLASIRNLPETNRDFDSMWGALAEAIVTYITANAIVTGPIAVNYVTGVTPGLLASGPGNGSMNNGRIS